MAFGGQSNFEWVRQQLVFQVDRRVSNQPLKDDWSSFLSEVRNVQQDRNRLAHDLWTVQEGEGSTYELRRVRVHVKQGLPEIVIESFPESFILDVSYRLGDLAMALPSLETRLREVGAFQWSGV